MHEALARLHALAPSADEWSGAIAQGFRTDGASVPLCAWWLARPCGVDCGDAGDLSYPPKPYPLHDYRFFAGGSAAEFFASADELRDYLFLWVMLHRDARRYSPAHVAWRVSLVDWGVRTRVAWRMWGRAQSRD